MMEQTYSVASTPKETIIRGRSLSELEQLIGSEYHELIDFMCKFGTKICERNGMVEIIIPRDCPVGADSFISKIYHTKRVKRLQTDRMWRGSI